MHQLSINFSVDLFLLRGTSNKRNRNRSCATFAILNRVVDLKPLEVGDVLKGDDFANAFFMGKTCLLSCCHINASENKLVATLFKVY